MFIMDDLHLKESLFPKNQGNKTHTDFLVYIKNCYAFSLVPNYYSNLNEKFKIEKKSLICLRNRPTINVENHRLKKYNRKIFVSL